MTTALDRLEPLLEDLRSGQLQIARNPDALLGISLRNADLSGLNLAGIDLRGADLTGAKFENANLFKANLCGAQMHGADLDGAELSCADLSNADLEGASAQGAGFGMAQLCAAKMFNADLTNATLSAADLTGADLRCANLENARLRQADLTDADLTEAKLIGADLSLSSVAGAAFTNADMRNARFRQVSHFKEAIWIGVDVRNVNFAGGYLLRRHIIDENYLVEFRQSGTIQNFVYHIWWLTSDCGRSVGRWCIFIAIAALLFGFAFSLCGLDIGQFENDQLTYLYFSVVTLTTLGYGDITPSTSTGQVLVMLEVIVGYMMLGGLLSLFANKIGRRGD